MKELLTRSLQILAVILITASTTFAQEETPPEAPAHPKDMLGMMHIESETNRDVNLLGELYHNDAALYILPDKVIAQGKEEIMKYWSEQFQKEHEIYSAVRIE